MQDENYNAIFKYLFLIWMNDRETSTKYPSQEFQIKIF